MKGKPCVGSIGILAVAIMLGTFISCHPSRSLKTSPDVKPAASDSSSKKMDTGPSEFFDGAFIQVKHLHYSL